MKIYDISQEVFSSRVYPGDPAPERHVLSDMRTGALYNLTALSLCAHNGTHIDAPRHFIADGRAIDELPLSHTVGEAYVASHAGVLSAADAKSILDRAEGAGAGKRILLKGALTVHEEAAQVFAAHGVLLLGNESQTVGPEDAPMAVHRILLGAGCVLLEGVRLDGVPDGKYLLSAAPLALGGADGAPTRALLIDLDAEGETE